MSRQRLWIGASALDTGLRFAAQMLTTVIVARLLPPEDFGVALMILSVVAVFGTFIGQPIEEALAQRHRLGLAHVRTALATALALTVAVLVLAPVVGLALARITGIRDIALWLPIATLFLIGEGPGAIVRALARRHRRFVALALCQSASVILASAAAIATASLAPGILVLILQRMLPIALLPALALAIAAAGGRAGGFFLRPAWHAARFRELLRFSSLHFSVVSMEALGPALVAYAVNAVFGTTLLGQLNIALRLVDPPRQLIGGTGHNLVFSMLYRMQGAPARLARAASDIVAHVGTLAIPAFLGLAACVPVLLPLLVGPGWEAAIPLARALCVGAAIYVPLGFLYSGYSALGRPEYGLAGSCLHLVVVLGGLWIARIGAVENGIGLAMLAGDLLTSLLAIGLLLPILGAAAGPPLARIGRIWVAAGVMAAAVDLARPRLGSLGSPFLDLALLVLIGALLYPALLLATCRSCFDGVRAGLSPKREPG